MDSIYVLLLTGFLIGVVGTLIGAGGGFILVPILLFVHPEFSTETITGISIAVVACNALSGSFAYVKARKVDYKAGFLFAAFAIPGSILGVYATKHISRDVFNVIFGILLILLAIYLLFKGGKTVSKSYDESKKGWIKRSLTDKSGTTYTYSFDWRLGSFISTIIGFISPMLGIGGGIIHVPALTEWLKFPVHIATATSHFILAIMATVSVVVHFIDGNYNDTYIATMILYIVIGVVPGAQIGALLSKRLKGKIIVRSLAICLGIVGVRILL